MVRSGKKVRRKSVGGRGDGIKKRKKETRWKRKNRKGTGRKKRRRKGGSVRWSFWRSNGRSEKMEKNDLGEKEAECGVWR